MSGPLWAPNRHPALLHSEGHLPLGQVAAFGTVPYQVLLLSAELCSPIKTVDDNPS